MLKTDDVRQEFKRLLAEQKFTSVNREASMTGLTGNTTVEIVGATFLADEESIFGEVNRDWVQREEAWYNTKSLNVNDIPAPVPAVWKAVADKDGFINSNYGWCIYSHENGFDADSMEKAGQQFKIEQANYTNQYHYAVNELCKNLESRRAVMIYTRPSMWLDYNKNGRSDFMCTNAVQYLVRDGAVHAVVQMRSNDAVFGYKGDRAWQHHVLTNVASELNVPVGNLYWNVGSLHVYSRHYHLIDPTLKKETT